MTANIDVTPGTGKTVATDEAGGFQHQLIKQVYGNATTAVRASAGAGAVDGGTPRYTHASDDPVVTGIGAQGTGSQYNPPTGGSGMIGYLSGILAGLLSTAASAVKDGGAPYEIVAVSQTDQILGAAGAAGDVLAWVRWRAGGTPTDVVVKDGVAGTTVFTIKAASQAANTEGTEFFGVIAATRWAVTTGAGTSAVCGGTFT
jgi:hypothetical protein